MNWRKICASTSYKIKMAAVTADSANGGKCFIRLKGVFVIFLTGFVKINEYTQKKKTIDLRTMPTFLSVIILENTI